MENKRIEINREPHFEVIIHALRDEGKTNLLIVWIILWTLAGLGIMTQFFAPQVEGFTTYLIVWLAFWLYFEYKVIYAFRWRKYGLERIRLEDETLSISREIAGRAIPAKFDIEWIKNLHKKEANDKNIMYALSKAYWNPGDEKISFNHRGKEITFGMELEEKEASEVIKALNHEIRNRLA